MGFWEDQVAELSRGIGVLLGEDRPGGGAPGPSPAPVPSDQLGPPPLGYEPPKAAPPPSTDGSLTRGALDDLHGTSDAPHPMPELRPPGALGPYGDDEIAPGVWVPHNSVDGQHYAPGSVLPAGDQRGAAATAATEADDRLRAAHDKRVRADDAVLRTVTQAHTSAQEAHMKLRTVRAQLQDGVRALAPGLKSASGQEQMAEFVHGKASEVLTIARQAQQSAQASAASLDAAAGGYQI